MQEKQTLIFILFMFTFQKICNLPINHHLPTFVVFAPSILIRARNLPSDLMKHYFDGKLWHGKTTFWYNHHQPSKRPSYFFRQSPSIWYCKSNIAERMMLVLKILLGPYWWRYWAMGNFWNGQLETVIVIVEAHNNYLGLSYDWTWSMDQAAEGLVLRLWALK